MRPLSGFGAPHQNVTDYAAELADENSLTALELARQPPALSREIGDRRAETDSLNVLATIDLRGGDAAPAPQAS